MAKNLLASRKHYISAYKNDVCIFHRGYDSFARALQAFAEQKEKSVDNYASLAMASFNGKFFYDCQTAPDHIVFWKGGRKKPFAEYKADHLVWNGSRFVSRETQGAVPC